MTGVALGFIPEPLLLAMDMILPSRKVPVGLATSRKYIQIRASIEEVGLIEPLSVAAVDASSGQHLLLDGHVRLVALRDIGHSAAPCLIATDDETYTYNNRINRLSTIQEHIMIRRAVERGVPPERLAKALSVDVSQITKKVNLLDGICPEAIELFKDRQFSVELGRFIRKMKPTRQVECAELMVAANNMTVAYAEALLVATPSMSLVEGVRPRKIAGVTPRSDGAHGTRDGQPARSVPTGRTFLWAGRAQSRARARVPHQASRKHQGSEVHQAATTGGAGTIQRDRPDDDTRSIDARGLNRCRGPATSVR